MTLHFVNGEEAKAKITKDGRKYTYFAAGAYGIKYRVNKKTGGVEVSPYWRKEPKMFVTMD